MDAFTKTTISEDPGLGERETVYRTALILDPDDSESGSVDILNTEGELLARVNFFTAHGKPWLAVDVIDVKEQFTSRRALTFENGQRNSIKTTGKVVAVDFR